MLQDESEIKLRPYSIVHSEQKKEKYKYKGSKVANLKIVGPFIELFWAVYD